MIVNNIQYQGVHIRPHNVNSHTSVKFYRFWKKVYLTHSNKLTVLNDKQF